MKSTHASTQNGGSQWGGGGIRRVVNDTRASRGGGDGESLPPLPDVATAAPRLACAPCSPLGLAHNWMDPRCV
eukprot:scaffold293256_cov30-Tisochrysis_lutea.AAC.1